MTDTAPAPVDYSTRTCRPLLDILVEEVGQPLPDGYDAWAFRSVNPDFTSSRGFRWPFPGGVAEAAGPLLKHRGSCPNAEGDGICVATTAQGMASGRITAGGPVLLTAHRAADVLGDSEPGKLRVRAALVVEVVWLQSANLRYADLQSANLQSADLQSANLQSADLQSADLQSANLRYANLRYANLQSANLQSANLQSADLQSADLQSADLQSANLRYANLRSANLRSANLQSANLRYANLQYADLQSANLRYANLQYADLQSANLQSANLQSADLQSANLQSAYGCACGCTKLPDGWKVNESGLIVRADA